MKTVLLRIKNPVFCNYQEDCSGCSLLSVSLSEQQSSKKSYVIKNLSSIFTDPQSQISLQQLSVFFAGESQFRNRVDYTLTPQGDLGLYHKTRLEVIDLKFCPLLSPDLQDLVHQFKKYSWQFSHPGNIRFRTYKSKKGIWFDLANIDIKKLLTADRGLLEKLSDQGIILEAGQKYKRILVKEDRAYLVDPHQEPWFETKYLRESVPLFCSIGHFTQTGLGNNILLVETLQKWSPLFLGHGLELGSGIGNLTFPIIAFAKTLTVSEWNESALNSMNKTLSLLNKKYPDLAKKIVIQKQDFHKKYNEYLNKDYDWVVANPARSGLKQVLPSLMQSKKKPQFFAMISCYFQSFIEDAQVLSNYNYCIKEIYILDQFPHTEHFELCVLFEKK